MSLKKVTTLAMLLALSVVISILESFIPFNAAPGIKLGLANAVIIFVIYMYGFKEAITLSIARVFLTSLLRTGLFSLAFFFSLSGALLSVVAMFLLKKTKIFSLVGISIVGSISHSIGQIMIAIIAFNNINIIWYLPWLLIFAIPTGIVVGLTAKEILKFFETEKKEEVH